MDAALLRHAHAGEPLVVPSNTLRVVIVNHHRALVKTPEFLCVRSKHAVARVAFGAEHFGHVQRAGASFSYLVGLTFPARAEQIFHNLGPVNDSAGLQVKTRCAVNGDEHGEGALCFGLGDAHTIRSVCERY